MGNMNLKQVIQDFLADEQMDKEYEREHEVDPVKRRVVNSRIKSTASSSLNSSESSLDEIGLHSDEYVKQLKDNVKELEDKFRKAMVNSAQLDNERQAYQYQVECLKDIIEDMTENLDNINDELMHKTKDFNKLSRDHEKLNEEFDKCMKLLADRERILDEHGINLDGTLRDEPDGGVVTTTTTTTNEIEEPLHNHIEYSEFPNAEKEALELEIQQLKDEIADLRSKSEADLTRREAEQIRTEGAELERSFVDVSDEANAIQDDVRHRGLYINNNEKCDEFEVIDDGSQQGGIKNFEDKSFEKSDRTSLMSSIQTGISESIESDMPLEISVDINQSGKQNEYDIVNTSDTNKSDSFGTALNIDSLTSNNERPNSPMPSSNLNIDKYFMSDDNETNDDELQTSTTFSINQYFASEEPASEKKLDTDSTEILEQDQHFENIDTSVLESIKDGRGAESPYLEVDAQVPPRDDIKPEHQYDEFHAVSLDDIDKKQPEERIVETTETEVEAVDEKFQDIGVGTEASLTESSYEKTSVILEASLTEEPSVQSTVVKDLENSCEVASQTLDTELNQAFSSEQNVSLGSEMESSVEYEFSVRKPTLPNEQNDSESGRTLDIESNNDPSSNSEHVGPQENLITDNEMKEHTGVLPSSHDVTDAHVKASEDGVAVRKDMEDLYDMIAKSASTQSGAESQDEDAITSKNELPPDATFGMFAVSTRVPNENPQKDAVFGLVARKEESVKPESPVQKKKEGWLVRVESFNAPKSNAPLIHQVRTKSEEVDSEEGASSPVTPRSPETPSVPKIEAPEGEEPVPKERKKKKKTKKNKGSAKIKENKDEDKPNHQNGGSSNAPQLSAPELLGYTSESPAASPTPSPNLQKRPSKSSNSEIPPQFLDVQFSVAGDSDLSDVEKDGDPSHADQNKTKPSGPSKRGSKKENCKTQ